MHYRDVIEYRLGADKGYDFALWAFGENFETIPTNILPSRWNDLHSDLFLLSDQGQILEDLHKMMDIWETLENK